GQRAGTATEHHRDTSPDDPRFDSAITRSRRRQDRKGDGDSSTREYLLRDDRGQLGGTRACRRYAPSDGLNLALRMIALIFMAPEVFEQTDVLTLTSDRALSELEEKHRKD